MSILNKKALHRYRFLCEKSSIGMRLAGNGEQWASVILVFHGEHIHPCHIAEKTGEIRGDKSWI